MGVRVLALMRVGLEEGAGPCVSGERRWGHRYWKWEGLRV